MNQEPHPQRGLNEEIPTGRTIGSFETALGMFGLRRAVESPPSDPVNVNRALNKNINRSFPEDDGLSSQIDTTKQNKGDS